ncbi:DUF2809 domain-containing protein [Cryobacterium adonitolivorans]|uniref:DUF2809 domain-containing protein n=1 Tax=Cryobacterium adonitolivorans TaxID=1259189 RepID=A0A4R8W680_9MICO|nr:DUF2809 domain-containing protein [Cryobacterium adonitolivorans]TFC01589.1 DUF2809 domain-containing protein [Cryobacterium adonitolivorans]
MDRKYRVSTGGVGQPDSGLDDESAQESRDLEATLKHGFRKRRLLLTATAGLIVVTGLLVHFSTTGIVGDFVGDALYAVLVYLVLSVVFVRRPSWQVAVAAILLCAALEVFQLTGLPTSLTELFAPFRYLLGTTFNALDLVAYAVGVLAATGVSTWRQPD